MKNKLYLFEFKIVIMIITVFAILISLFIPESIFGNDLSNDIAIKNDYYNDNNNSQKSISHSGQINIRSFKFSGANRHSGSSQTYQEDSNVNFINNNIFRIGYQRNGSYYRQVRMATSNVPLSLKRDFEVISSFKMAQFPHHGFVFSVHNNPNYKATNTGGALGIYQDTGTGESKGNGLSNAFVMEVDAYDDGGYGDNRSGVNKNHLEILETGDNGKYYYMNGTGPWGQQLIYKQLNGNELYGQENIGIDRVYFKFKWHPTAFGQGVYSITFGQGIDPKTNDLIGKSEWNKFNVINASSSKLNEIARSSSGNAWISLGGSLEVPDNFKDRKEMELGIHKFGYTDLEPIITTEFFDENDKNRVNAVTPGQIITIRHKFRNNVFLGYDVHDNLELKYVFMQFVTNNELSQTMNPNHNIDAYDVKIGINESNLETPPPSYGSNFSNGGRLPLIFPKEGKYYHMRYKIKVPERLGQDDKYYREELNFYLSTVIGHSGYDALDSKEVTKIRLRPKIFSIRSNASSDTKNRHEVYKFNDKNTSRNQAINELWNNIRITSVTDINASVQPGIPHGTSETKGSYIKYKYYLNGNEVRPDQIPDPIPKGSALSLALEAKDKSPNINLKSYFDKTIIIADSYSFSNDGRIILYGNNNIGSYKETELSMKNLSDFKNEVLQKSATKSLIRNYNINQDDLSSFLPDNKFDILGIASAANKVDLSKGLNKITIRNNGLSIETSLNVNENTYSIDNGNGNRPDGNIGYVIIPSSINLTDDNTGNAVGEGKIILSGYTTNKRYRVWADKEITLKSSDSKSLNIKTFPVSNTSANPNQSFGTYLGDLNANNPKNYLKVRLSGKSYSIPNIDFSGSLSFKFERY